MDGTFAVGVIVAGGLLAWSWWLSDKAAVRAHELELRKQAVSVDQKTIDALPLRLSALEATVKDLQWKK